MSTASGSQGPPPGTSTDLSSARVFVVLGDQLFPIETLRGYFPPGQGWVYLAEDAGLYTREKYHLLRLSHSIASMREYRDALVRAGYRVRYEKLDEGENFLMSYEEKLSRFLSSFPAGTVKRIETYEIADRFFEKRWIEFSSDSQIEHAFHSTPYFLTPLETTERLIKGARKPIFPFFYEQQRRRLKILMDPSGQPSGGRFNFDLENRKSLPESAVLADPRLPTPTQHALEAQILVEKLFPSHLGKGARLWIPTNRAQALAWLNDFLEKRFANSGTYEDALSKKSTFVYHGGLSPLLNSGLLTPKEVVDFAVRHAESRNISIAAVEGFVRQVIGWREFMRGIDRLYGERQRTSNRWGAERKLAPAWTTGELGLPLADHVIRKTREWGYAHHNERLMVIGNLMTLCEIRPKDAYRWFMQHFVDAAEWVTAPNVYGLAISSDGGIFSNKPFISGSTYWMRMGNEEKGEWEEILDGLYWRFLDKHRPELMKIPSSAVLFSGLRRMEATRRKELIKKADEFIERVSHE